LLKLNNLIITNHIHPENGSLYAWSMDQMEKENPDLFLSKPLKTNILYTSDETQLQSLHD